MEYIHVADTTVSYKTPRVLYIASTNGSYCGAMAVGGGIEGK